MIKRLWPLITLLCLFAPAPSGGDDFPDDMMERIERVNGGELRFLSSAPEKPVHHHENRIRITESGIESGWVMLEQCHSHLDPVPELEIVYHPERIRKLRIVSQLNIGGARVEGPSVQLKDIRPNARICLSAESRALRKLDDGRLQLRNGPFMRRFLDGYYPMRVSLDIRYPAAILHVDAVQPAPEKGFDIERKRGKIRVNTLFEGRLTSRFTFCRKGQDNCPIRVE